MFKSRIESSIKTLNEFEIFINQFIVNKDQEIRIPLFTLEKEGISIDDLKLLAQYIHYDITFFKPCSMADPIFIFTKK